MQAINYQRQLRDSDAELITIKDKAEDATEYVLVQINSDLRDEIEKLRAKLVEMEYS